MQVGEVTEGGDGLASDSTPGAHRLQANGRETNNPRSQAEPNDFNATPNQAM